MKSKSFFPPSELILNPDGSIYHLSLRPEMLADTVILVGDPGRVEKVSRHFDRIEFRAEHREFISHTGYMNNKRLTVLSTGIGTDNIDIVFNELDALLNIDFSSRTLKDEIKTLDIIRLGTSGSLQPDIPVDSILLSEAGIGLDGLLFFYEWECSIQETQLRDAFMAHMSHHLPQVAPYAALGSAELLGRLESRYPKGVTVTAPGFYAPQGRVLRAPSMIHDFLDHLRKFQHPHYRLTNFEMETAGIYGMGKVFGHHCLSVNAILANRANNTFSSEPEKVVARMIEEVLEVLTTH